VSVARFVADQRAMYRVPHAVTCAILGVPPGAASMGRSAPTRQCGHPRITDLAGGARPDDVDQVLREAPRGTRSVVRHVEEMM